MIKDILHNRNWPIPVILLSISITCVCISQCLAVKELDKRITQIEGMLYLDEDWQPEPWMFQPATEECNPDEDLRCWE